MKSCRACGTTDLPDYARFCGHCGQPLSATTTIDKVMNTGRFLPAYVQSPDIFTAYSSIPLCVRKLLGHLPMPIQRFIVVALTRAQDTEPEIPRTRHQKVAGPEPITWGWLPMLALTSSLGVFAVAYAYNAARNNATGANIFFYFGLLLIFVPSLVRLLSPSASRFERISLLCVTGICFYLVKVMLSPLSFSEFDEFLHWRTADDIARSGHLFSVNALLPISPFYSGLEIVTNALSRLSGLSTFKAGTIVIGVARLVMILSLFILNEQVTKSPRLAGIATILYMSNPHFLFFDSLFAYESLALPLATLMLFAVAQHETLNSERHWMMLIAWIVLGAVIMTHHMTNFIFDGFLLLWAVLYAFLHPVSLRQSSLIKTTLLGVFLTAVRVVLLKNVLVQYITSFGNDTLSELEQLLAGSDSTHHLFIDYAHQPTSQWEHMIALSSVGFISLCLPFALLCLWQRYRYNALVCMFGVISLSYPAIQALHLTNSGAEASDRASAFIFIPITCALAIFIVQFWPVRRLSWKHTLLISCTTAVVFLGGIILGAGPSSSILPGPYLVAADARSIEPEGIQTAIWARLYLGPNNRIATDRTNQLLMSTYGDQRLVTPSEDNIDVTDVFFSPSLDAYELSLLQRAQVHYLVVDQRLSQALPSVGYYFEQGEPGSFDRTTPINLKVLTKFDTIPQINRLLDSGDIVIYDTGGLIDAPKKP